jgi:hypothetical protein
LELDEVKAISEFLCTNPEWTVQVGVIPKIGRGTEFHYISVSQGINTVAKIYLSDKGKIEFIGSERIILHIGDPNCLDALKEALHTNGYR